MRGHDLALAAAGAAFYGALCLVPSILVAISLAQIVLGPDRLHRYGAALAHALPSAIGADTAALGLLDAGITLTPVGVVLAVVLASAYGEGTSRARPASRPPTRARSRGPSGCGWRRCRCSGSPRCCSPGPCSRAVARADGVRRLRRCRARSYVSLTLVWVLTGGR